MENLILVKGHHFDTGAHLKNYSGDFPELEDKKVCF